MAADSPGIALPPVKGKWCWTQDSKKYANTTSFVVTAVTTNLVVTAIGLIAMARLVYGHISRNVMTKLPVTFTIGFIFANTGTTELNKTSEQVFSRVVR